MQAGSVEASAGGRPDRRQVRHRGGRLVRAPVVRGGRLDTLRDFPKAVSGVAAACRPASARLQAYAAFFAPGH